MSAREPKTKEEKAEERKAKRASAKKRADKTAKIIFILLGAFFFLIFFGRLLWGPIGVHIPYSAGERNIKIVKITTKGLIWKTWEIEGIIAPGQGIATTYLWEFSVDDDDPAKEALLDQLQYAFQKGIAVKVTYDQRAGSVPWRSDTSYWVKKIDAIPY